MQPARARFLSLTLFLVSATLLLTLAVANGVQQFSRRRRAEEQRRATSRSAAMYGTVQSGFTGGSTSGSSMFISDLYAAAKWPLLVLTILGGSLSLRFGVFGARLANTGSWLTAHPAAAAACTLTFAGLLMLLVAAGWHVSNTARVRRAQNIDRADRSARTHTGLRTTSGGTMSVTFGQPTNESRAAEEKLGADLPKIALLAASGLVSTLAGITALAFTLLRTRGPASQGGGEGGSKKG